MAKLAINGGKPVVKNFSWPPWPQFTTGDEDALISTLHSRNWCRLTEGPVAKFEKAYAKYHDAKFAVCVANGTVSLELALRTLGVGAGDEVIVPAITFIATASAVTSVGAVPIFADSNPATYAIDANSIEQKITPKTKAVIGVHYGGYPFDFDRIIPLVRKHKLFLIEDCAHAHGTEWKGKKVGALGDIGSFSFQNSKALASGEGGIVLTNHEKYFQKAWLIHNIGRHKGRLGYSHYCLSSNYRLSEFLGALLCEQLKRLPGQVETRHKNGIWLESELAKQGLIPLKRDRRITKRGYYFFIIRYAPESFGNVSRDAFIRALNAEIPVVGAGYGVPLYKNVAFEKKRFREIIPSRVAPRVPDYQKLHLPVAEKICREQLTIGHRVLLAPKTRLQYMLDAIAKIKDNLDELKKYEKQI